MTTQPRRILCAWCGRNLAGKPRAEFHIENIGRTVQVCPECLQDPFFLDTMQREYGPVSTGPTKKG